LPPVRGELLERYAKLVAGVGANVQHGQQVLVIAGPHAAPLVRAVAAECYARGAVFVDPWYFDPVVKRIRAAEADPETLEFVPPWYPKRLLELGAAHGSRISISPTVPPGLLDGVDPALAGRDQLPSLREHFDVINAKTTNWSVVPWPTEAWANVAHPELEPADALAKLEEELVYVLRLDEEDAAAAWRERGRRLKEVGRRLTERRFDALRARCAKDAGAARLGEGALVDGEGRIGKTGTVFFNTLLDENAASHLALGNAYATTVGEVDRERINTSTIHIDFMIGSPEVAVTGLTGESGRVPVLRGGRWQI
jgi:leucyl aminopeptidase (aminopeptidase T)